MIVCLCAGIPTSRILELLHGGAACPEEVTAACGAGGGCGACLDSLADLVARHHRRSAVLDLASR